MTNYCRKNTQPHRVIMRGDRGTGNATKILGVLIWFGSERGSEIAAYSIKK